jgi:hypothetical protein
VVGGRVKAFDLGVSSLGAVAAFVMSDRPLSDETRFSAIGDIDMKRMAVGAALGGLAAYFYDPKLGADRRGRIYSLWQENRDTAVQVGQTASRALESARPVARRVTQAVGRGDWAQVLERRRPSATVPKLVGAAALGGALMYFLDPVQGSERRRSAVARGRQVVAKIVEAAKTVPDRVGGAAADSEDRVKSRVG